MPMYKIVIGANGSARTGKDTVGKYLESKGFTRISFAEPLKKATYDINPIIKVSLLDVTKFELDPQHASGIDTQRMYCAFFELQYIVDTIGWEQAKEIEHVRVTLQRQGTEGGRNIHGSDCWIKLARNAMEGLDKVVITDVRFSDEATFVRDYPADMTSVIKLTRPGYGPVNSHSSDVGLCGELCDFYVENDGSIEDLHRKIDNVLGLIWQN